MFGKFSAVCLLRWMAAAPYGNEVALHETPTLQVTLRALASIRSAVLQVWSQYTLDSPGLSAWNDLSALAEPPLPLPQPLTASPAADTAATAAIVMERMSSPPVRVPVSV